LIRYSDSTKQQEEVWLSLFLFGKSLRLAGETFYRACIWETITGSEMMFYQLEAVRYATHTIE